MFYAIILQYHTSVNLNFKKYIQLEEKSFRKECFGNVEFELKNEFNLSFAYQPCELG